MKKIKNRILLTIALSGMLIASTSCADLDQASTTEMGSSEFWESEDDAALALNGAVAHVKGLFNRDYYFDGQGDYVRVRDGSGNLSTTETNIGRGAAYKYGLYFPDPAWEFGSKFDRYYQYLYGGVHRTNYVIENVEKMLPEAKTQESKENLEAIIGEARMLRGMVYFRLISMWGDVPYFDRIIKKSSEVDRIGRTSINVIKDSIYSDFTYAYNKLPNKAQIQGRASKPAALAFRGKLNLYWGSWKKNGWPELGSFIQDQAEAKAAYTQAAADFRSVIDDYGLNLFRQGAPGDWGTLGNGEVLPNYYYLFIPSTGNLNAEGEMIYTFNHGGPGTFEGESLLRDFAGRNFENSQAWVTPVYELADRYQSTITGDFADPLIPMNPNAPGARTTPGSAVNPDSYLNRDYRMKSSIMWDYEMSKGLLSLQENGWVPFLYKTWGDKITIDGKTYTTYNTDGTNSGYVFRKFVRNYGGAARDEGNYNWPVMRLADVFLMYAEADNEVNGPQPYAINLLNRIRERGNLPALKSDKTANRDTFFDAIEQERIVELVAEGHRAFDLRRWRAIERVWGPPGSDEVWRIDTHGGQQYSWFKNLTEVQYQQCYIFKIPQSERDRNPNLSQNKPWL